MIRNSKGISYAMFAGGLMGAVLISSVISVGVVTLLGIKGPKGDTGNTGATGPQGPPGASGVSKIPFAKVEWADIAGYSGDYTNSTEYTDIEGMSLSITTEKSSNLLIIFSAHLMLQTPDAWSGSASIRALVDNGGTSPMDALAITIEAEDNGQTDDRNTFVFNRAVSPGTHVVKMQWKVPLSDWRIFLTFIGPEAHLQVYALPMG